MIVTQNYSAKNEEANPSDRPFRYKIARTLPLRHVLPFFIGRPVRGPAFLRSKSVKISQNKKGQNRPIRRGLGKNVKEGAKAVLDYWPFRVGHLCYEVNPG